MISSDLKPLTFKLIAANDNKKSKDVPDDRFNKSTKSDIEREPCMSKHYCPV